MNQETDNQNIPIFSEEKIVTSVDAISNSTVESTNNQVKNILSEEISEDLRLPSFVVQKENGIFVNIENLVNREIFFTFLNYIFENGHYFRDTNYTLISNLLYSFEKTKKFVLENIKNTSGSAEIKIASSIEKFDEKRIWLYREVKVTEEMSAEYSFGPAFLEEVWENGKITEIPAKIDIDEFIAAIWNQKIRFGLKIKDIQKAIDEDKAARVIVAEGMEPTPGTDASLEEVVFFGQKLGIKNTGPRVDLQVYEQNCAQVNEGDVIYKKIPRKDEENGWSVHGDQVDPEVPKDFSIESYVGIGVEVKMINGASSLVAIYDGFPLREGDVINWNEDEWSTFVDGKKTKRLRKIHVNKEQVFADGINMKESGKIIDSQRAYNSGSDVLCNTEAKKMTIDGNVVANVHSLEGVFVGGNVIGNSRSNPFCIKNEKFGGEPQGRVVTADGDITVEWHAHSAYLEAKKGIVRIPRITNSIIVAKRVEITQSVFNCIIIADEIVITGKVIDCKMISSGKISIEESTEKGSFENTFSLFSLDLTKSIEMKKKLLEEEEKTLIGKQEKIDDDLVKISKMSTIIPDRERRVGITKSLIEIGENPEQTEGKDEKVLALFKAMKPFLAKVNVDWKKYKKIQSSIKILTEEIEAETIAHEAAEKDLHLEIKKIECPTYVQQIKFTENRKLLDFTNNQMEDLYTLLMGLDIPPVFKVEKMDVPFTGQFYWPESN